MHVLFEFIWVALAELLDWNFSLLLFDICVLFSLWSSWKSLPWERAHQEVKDDMTNCLKIISSWLFVTNMGVDTSISGSTCQILSISEWDVFTIWALITFGKTKIDDIYGVFCLFSSSSHEVIWFDISMDNTFLVNNLDSLNHLDSNMKHSLEIKLSSAFLEQIFHTLTKEIHNHNVVHLTIFSLFITYKM